MRLKSFIIGLVFLCIGGGMLWWIVSERHTQEQKAEEFKLKYGLETKEYIKLYDEWMLVPIEERSDVPAGLNLNADKTQEQIAQEQEERLIADMDKLAAGEMTVYPFADDFYGRGWEDKIEEYKQAKEQREFFFSVSIACACSGGLLTGWVVLLSIARGIIKICSKLKHSVSSNKDGPEDIENADVENNDEENEQNEKLPLSENNDQQDDEHFTGISNVLANSGWQYAGSFGGEQKQRIRQRKRIPRKNKALNENINSTDSSKEQQTVEEISDTNENKTKEKVGDAKQDLVKSESEIIDKEAKDKNDIDVTNPKGQTHHIDTTLKDLSQQVSAIREYAASQQNRLERLQDGYDWNIIKTFCLRIIRCIDNIERRILQITEEGIEATHLEEVRDELVFALESSGIEQFEPKVNTYYRGQEKIAEAIKDKAKSKDSNQKGKIEKVIKPGYQFYIDDENVKIVRPAQVRIYA